MYRVERESDKERRLPVSICMALILSVVVGFSFWWLWVSWDPVRHENRKQVRDQERDLVFSQCKMSASDVYTTRNGRAALRPNRRRGLEDKCMGISSGLIVPTSSECPFLMAVYPLKDGTYDLVSNSVRLTGQWEPQESSIIQSLPRPSFFVDIGANIGWHSLLALSLGHRVLAFEPLYANVELLQHSLCLNPGLQEHLELHTIALTDGNKKDCRMSFRDDNAGNGVLLCGNQSNGELGISQRNVHETSIGRLDDFLRPGQHIDLIKIDVEGNELAVLRSGELLFEGGRGHRPPLRIISEYAPKLIHELGEIPVEYLKFLSSKGYTLYHIERNVEAWDKPANDADSSLTKSKTKILHNEFESFTVKHWDAILTIDAILS